MINPTTSISRRSLGEADPSVGASPLGATIARQEWKEAKSSGNGRRKREQSRVQQRIRATTSSIITSYADTKKANASMVALMQGVTVYALCLFLPSLMSTVMTMNWTVQVKNQCTQKRWLCEPLLWTLLFREEQLFWSDEEYFNMTAMELQLSTFAPDTSVSDAGIVILLTLGMACLRVLLVHLLVPNHMAPQQMEAIVRCKSVHLLSADYKRSLTPKGEGKRTIDISDFSNKNQISLLLPPFPRADEHNTLNARASGQPTDNPLLLALRNPLRMESDDDNDDGDLGLSMDESSPSRPIMRHPITSNNITSSSVSKAKSSEGGFLPPSIDDDEEHDDEQESAGGETLEATPPRSNKEGDTKEEQNNIEDEDESEVAIENKEVLKTDDAVNNSSNNDGNNKKKRKKKKKKKIESETTDMTSKQGELRPDSPSTPPQPDPVTIDHDLLARLGYNNDDGDKIYPPHAFADDDTPSPSANGGDEEPMPWLRRRSSGASLAAAVAAAVQEEDDHDDIVAVATGDVVSVGENSDLVHNNGANGTNGKSTRMFAAPRYATAVFRLLYCTVSAAMAWILFRNADFWPWYVGGHGKTKRCWDLSGSLALAKNLDSDFDHSNSMLRIFFLIQASYHLHSGAFHIFSVVLMLYMKKKAEKGKEQDPRKQRHWVVRVWKTIYFRTLFQHSLSLVWLCVSYAFSSLRRLGAIGMFALDMSSVALHLLQTCINAPDHSVLRKPKVIQFVLVVMVLPSYVYFRFYVWPLVGYSAMTESDRWLQQLESTLVPGSAQWFRITLQVWMMLWMAFHLIHFQRLVFHPHLQRIFATDSLPVKTENPQEAKAS